MTVYFNRARRRWQYDFIRNGTRYQGYAEHPETGEPARSKREAQEIEALAKARARMETPPVRKSADVAGYTLAEALADYADKHARHKRDWVTQKGHLRELLAHFNPATVVEEMTPEDIDAYIQWSRAQPTRRYIGGPASGGDLRETGRTRSPHTVNGYLTTLRSALNRALRLRRVKFIPPISTLKGPEDLPNPVRPEDARSIMAEAEPHVRDTIALCSLTGMRLRECLRLRWEQVDLDRATITLDSRTKANRGRALYLTDEALAILRRLHAERPAEAANVILYRFRGKGEPRPVNSISKGWKGALRRAGLEGRYKFHGTRGTFCTALADAGADPLAIKELAGHASITTTLRYIRASDVRLREMVARLPKLSAEPVSDCVSGMASGVREFERKLIKKPL
jgi:integrase